MLRRVAVFLDKTLYFLESGNDAFLTGGAPALFSGGANSSSSERSSSRSKSPASALILEVTNAAAPSAIRFSQASVELIEGSRPLSFLNLMARTASSLGLFRSSGFAGLAAIAASTCLRLSSAHRLGDDGVGLPEGIDPIDEIDVEVAHVHGKLTNTINQGCIARSEAAASQGKLLGLLCQVECSDGVLSHSLPEFSVGKFGILVLDDLPYTHLSQLLRHKLLVKDAALDSRFYPAQRQQNHLVRDSSLTDAGRFLALRLDQVP